MRFKKIGKALWVLLFLCFLLAVPGAVLASSLGDPVWRADGGKAFLTVSCPSGAGGQPFYTCRLYYYPSTKVVRVYLNGRLLQPGSGHGADLSSQPKPEPVRPPQTGSGSNTQTVQGLSADEQRMVELVNQERAKYGLAPLKANMDLVRVARLKAKDMVDKNYFSHTSPTYGSPFAMMQQFGISYRTAGENLAGAPSVEIAHQNLMNSSGHRANILNSSFSQIGIGVVEGSIYGKIFVQMFIG